jgi:hypothetical protein
MWVAPGETRRSKRSGDANHGVVEHTRSFYSTASAVAPPTQTRSPGFTRSYSHLRPPASSAYHQNGGHRPRLQRGHRDVAALLAGYEVCERNLHDQVGGDSLEPLAQYLRIAGSGDA